MLKIPQINLATPDLMEQNPNCGTDFFPPYYNDLHRFPFYYDDYKVTLNGKSCPVHGCNVSRIPFNTCWPGEQRDASQSEKAGFISFSADEAVTLCVETVKIIESVALRPASKNIKTEVRNDKVYFTLTEPGSYVLEVNGQHNALHIFYNPVKEYPEKESATYYFGPGLHFPGTINLRDNDSVYIDEEAIVFGSLYTMGAKNVHIYGGGILDNSCEERMADHCYENFTKGTFRIYNSENFLVEDIILVNSSTWILSMFYCNNITIDNVKLVGHWRYNTDGIDIVNTSNVTVKNSFIRSFDDTITIKGIYSYDKPIENILVENCVLWCGWGHTLELGVETWAPEYKNITFRNCDVIRASGPALAVVNGRRADIHCVTYENINVELFKDSYRQQQQPTRTTEYISLGKICPPILIGVFNSKSPEDQAITNGADPENLIPVRTHDIHFKNIHVRTDSPNLFPIIMAEQHDERAYMGEIDIDGLYLNGERQKNFDAFELEGNSIDKFKLK